MFVQMSIVESKEVVWLGTSPEASGLVRNLISVLISVLRVSLLNVDECCEMDQIDV